MQGYFVNLTQSCCQEVSKSTNSVFPRVAKKLYSQTAVKSLRNRGNCLESSPIIESAKFFKESLKWKLI